MPDPFDEIIGQPRVCSLLRTIVRDDSASHAYLFTGPVGSNKLAAARAFARALLCDRGGCMECDSCRKAARSLHPDITVLEPEGASGYVVEQVRAVISDANLAPILSKRKAYIFNDADRFNSACANAFLKTLEEPPSDVVIIMLARTRDCVLPTIASRCLTVAFRTIPPQEAAAIVSRKASVPIERAMMALAACEGSIEQAIAFSSSNALLELRRVALRTMDMLPQADDWDVLRCSQSLLAAAKAPLDDLRLAQEADAAEKAEFLPSSAMRQIEQRNKRALTFASRQAIFQMLAVMQSWLRDAIALKSGCPDEIANSDAMESLRRNADILRVEDAVAALGAIRLSAEHIAYNVSAQACIDAMLLQMKRILYG